MENLAHGNNTPGTDAAFDLLSRIALDQEADERYPDGTVLIPADTPDASVLISRAIEGGKPIALVFADGSDVVARPPESSGVFLLLLHWLLRFTDLATRNRDRPTFVPREWVTEFHAARPSRKADLVR